MRRNLQTISIMLDKVLFEYAVIRCVPRVEREEFVNVGVILFCPKQKFLSAKIVIDAVRLQTLFKGIDVEEIESHLEALVSISKGEKQAGPIALLDQASRFRWLTATRSTVVQTSKVHPGFTTDADATLNKLFTEQVITQTDNEV